MLRAEPKKTLTYKKEKKTLNLKTITKVQRRQQQQQHHNHRKKDPLKRITCYCYQPTNGTANVYLRPCMTGWIHLAEPHKINTHTHTCTLSLTQLKQQKQKKLPCPQNVIEKILL